MDTLATIIRSINGNTPDPEEVTLEELPIDYKEFCDQLIESTAKTLDLSLKRNKFLHTSNDDALIPNAAKYIKSAIINMQKNSLIPELKIGEKVRPVQLLGFDVENPDKETYYYGGDTDDIPLGIEAFVAEIPTKERIKVIIKNGKQSKIWQLHPNEIETTSENIYSALMESNRIETSLSEDVKKLFPGFIHRAKILVDSSYALSKSFVPLDIEMPKALAPFSIYTSSLEQQLIEKYGRPDISKLKLRCKIDEAEEKNCNTAVPGFKYRRDYQHLAKAFKGLKTPCSMHVHSLDELKMHISIVYQIAFNHYVLGKSTAMQGRFPNNCCGESGGNMFNSLLNFGYVNTFKMSSNNDHCYVSLPFVLDGVGGCVVCDPTSNQMWHKLKIAPRNAVFIMLGPDFEYKTHWHGGVDLIPGSCNYISIENNHASTKNGEIRKSLENAYNNPVRLFNRNDIL